jgi:hypothetical protein
MTTRNEFLSLLGVETPRQTAGRILEFLVRLLEARGAVLLALRGETSTIFASAGDLEPQRVVDACAAWRWHKADLEAGRLVQAESHLLAPAIAPGKGLVALLYAETGRKEELAELAPIRETLALCVVGQGGAPWEKGGGTPHRGEEGAYAPPARDILLRALEQNQWNIAVVARKLGVTRRTIYLRMERFGIDRKKVPKILKPAPGGAA